MNILLYPNSNKDKDLKFTKQLIKELKKYNANCFIDECCGEYIDLPVIDNINIKNIDLIITIGGDGTFLQGARYAYQNDIPITGFNLGHMGFLAELEVDELNLIDSIINRKFIVDERMLLNIKIYKDNELIFNEDCINDVVIRQGYLVRILDFELLHNGKFFSRYRADGVLICTPIGSTAYSLSAGGPIIDPMVRCMSMVPICAHTMKSRPVIFSEDSELTIKIKNMSESDAYAYADGSRFVKIDNKCRISVSKSERKLKIIRLKDRSFYEIFDLKMK